MRKWDIGGAEKEMGRGHMGGTRIMNKMEKGRVEMRSIRKRIQEKPKTKGG